jgi:hypothetical protein
LVAAPVTLRGKLSRGTIIVDPGLSLKLQAASKPPFAVALALRKGSSFKKKSKINNHTKQELVTTA